MSIDLINTPKPDERAIMTYVSCYYHAFQGAQQVGIKNSSKILSLHYQIPIVALIFTFVFEFH